MSDMFDMLDKSIDDLADLPSFKVPDTGIYKLGVTVEVKEINNKPSVIAHCRVDELVELEDETIAENERARNGDKFDVAFILKDTDGNDNEMGWGRLKEFCKPFENHFGEKNLRTLLTQHLGSEVLVSAKVKKQARKSEPDKFDARISNIVIE